MHQAILVTATVGLGAFLLSPLLPFFALLLPFRQSKPLDVPDELPDHPSIDIIVPAYLEAGAIASKISSLRQALAHHSGKSRIIVVSSDSETTVHAQHADLVITSGRIGKAAACNQGFQASQADILVFTDANCQISPYDWIPLLISDLTQNHLLSAPKSEVGGSEGLFWRFEDRLKSSALGRDSLAVAGEFMATRRADFTPLSPGTILDDFEMAAAYSHRGLRVGLSQTIRSSERSADPADQWQRRIRIAEGLYKDAIPKLPSLSRSHAGQCFILHKIYRVTLGCLGFWVATIALSLFFPKFTMAAIPTLAYSVITYKGKMPSLPLISPLLTVLALQAIPPLALYRHIVARVSNGNTEQRNLWPKVQR